MVQDDIPELDIERYRVAVQVHVAAGRPGLPFLARREMEERVKGNARLGRGWWAEHEAEIRQLWRRIEREAGLSMTARGGTLCYDEMDERALEGRHDGQDFRGRLSADTANAAGGVCSIHHNQPTVLESARLFAAAGGVGR